MKTAGLDLILTLTLALFGQSAVFGKVPPPPAVPPVPHHDVTDRFKAEAVVEALDALFASEHLPDLAAGQEYEIPTLSCRNMWVPVMPPGYDCTLQYRIGQSGQLTQVTVKDAASVKRAENLFKALVNAGSTVYDDPAHGAYVTLKNLVVKEGEVQFDDYSTYRPPPQPNVTVTGAVAQNLLAALDSAQIDDSDGSLLLICTSFDEAGPQCSYQLHQEPFPPLKPELSAQLWRVVKDAALVSGLTPPWGGSLDQMTVFNASDLSFDGTRLGIVLVVGDAKPPKPSGPRQ